MPRQVTSSIAERGPVLEVVDGEPETRLRNQVELRARAEVVKQMAREYTKHGAAQAGPARGIVSSEEEFDL